MPITFVTGTARSGTSFVTEVLRACGAQFGNVNPMGEHTFARETVLKVYLEKCGADPLGQYPLPEYHELVHDGGFGDDLLTALAGADFYKDPKLSLIWPTVRRHFPDARWVICRREVEAIAKSCMAAKFMRHYHDQYGWARWAQEYVDRIEDLKESDAEYGELWPGHSIAVDDYSAFREVVEFCGLEWDEDAVRSVVRPQEWHH